MDLDHRSSKTVNSFYQMKATIASLCLLAPRGETPATTQKPFIAFVFNEIKMFARSQHGVASSGGLSYMFIEKNGRNFSFGQPTIKGWSSVSPSRLIALTVSRLLAAKKCSSYTVPYVTCLFLHRFLTASSHKCQQIFACTRDCHNIPMECLYSRHVWRSSS